MRQLIVIFVLVLCIGCKTPLSDWLRLGSKQDKTEQKINDNQSATIEKAKQYVHGTGSALRSDPEPNKYNTTAQSLNERAGLILGAPDYESAIQMDKIVEGLLSTNEQIRVKAQKDLEIKDKQVIHLQTELEKLQGKLTQIQKEKDELGLANSQMADKWAKMWRWIKIIFWGIVIGIALLIISQILSAILPSPYSNALAICGLILGGIGKMVFKLFPSSKKYTGVVDEETHKVTESTLTQLVRALQDIRYKDINPEEVIPKVKPTKIKDIIDPVLKDYTDSNVSRVKIIEKKKEIGII